MTNLTPQLRVDRNGKAVTRHVKEDAAPAQRRAFAAPTLPGGLSQKEIEKERPLRKMKKRKVTATTTGLAAFYRPEKSIPAGAVEMSDQDVYAYLKTGLSVADAVAFSSIGVSAHEWQSDPAQGIGEADSAYTARMMRLRNETKRIGDRRERYADVAHRLELRGIPADTASKSLENGLSMKALSGYLTESEVCEIYSKNGYLKNTMKVMDELVNGVIPFDHFKAFGMRNLTNWEKNCPVYRQMPTELIGKVLEKHKTPYPGIDSAAPSEQQLIKMAAEDERVLDLRLPELMWHGFRLERDGGSFSYEEAKVVDDFIHEVRTRGITDLEEHPRSASKQLEDFYPGSGVQDSRYECGKILDWHNAGLSTDQIISGLQNRWNKEQAVGVYLEGGAGSLADGML